MSGSRLMKMPKLILFSIIFLSTVVTLVESLPAPVPDVTDVFNDAKKAWDTNEVHEFTTDDGKVVKLSTRDVILIAAASFIVVVILLCCIGYCLCECVKNLICCICCCRDC